MNDKKIEISTMFDEKKHDILYHYCTTETFLSIIRNKILWMSDINTMNDFSEMHWAYQRFEEAAGSVMEIVGREFLDEIDLIISSSQARILPMLTSFSTDGDVLSQWRAYTNDGTGIAVGFDSRKISSLSVRIGSIEYSREKQVKHLAGLILLMHENCIGLSGKKRDDLIFEHSSNMGVDMAFFKNSAFSEEKEVRIIRATNPIFIGGNMTLSDPGGSGEPESRKKLPIQFRSGRSGGIVPYVEMPLGGLGKNLIKEIIIGPKSVNNGNEVSMALSRYGYSGYKILHSQATYR